MSDEVQVTVTGDKSLNTIQEIGEAVENLGFDVGLENEVLTVAMNVEDQAFPVIMEIEHGKLVVRNQFCLLGDIAEDDLPSAAMTALLMNAEIHPYAFCVVDAGGDGVDPTDPVILIDSIPVGDLSEGEVEKSLDSLRQALTLAINAIPRTAVAS